MTVMRLNKNTSEYVLIVIPPAEIISWVESYREKYAHYTEYKIVPHLTVYPPFYFGPDREDDLTVLLKTALSQVDPFVVNLNKIGFFEGKNNVVFVEPDKESSDFVKNLLVSATVVLRSRVKNVYADYNFTLDKFKPHMTIAEKLPPDLFIDVKKELEHMAVKKSFLVNSVWLYRERDNWSKIWEPVNEIKF